MKKVFRKLIFLTLVAVFVMTSAVFSFAEAESGTNEEPGTNEDHIVVVLDPGHGGSDTGACANGLQEKDLNLKIAKYCKEELLKYHGIEVYMTRESDVSTPGKDPGEVMDNLVKVGTDHNADFFVSLHVNSGGGTGVEVWYPNNSSWKNEYHAKGAEISDKILSEIVKLGLYNRGKKTRDYTEDGGRYYPDKSIADYYGVIRKSRVAGFPGIIVEHAFIDKASDAAFLSSEANLKKLGVADATGIAKYFGLEKGVWEETEQGKKYKYTNGEYAVGWEKINDYFYYFDAQGFMMTGWQKIGSLYYYLYPDGHMAANEKTPDGYNVDSSGAWIRAEWKKNSIGWWYQHDDGTFAKGWEFISGKWYYFNGRGYMQTGWQKIAGKDYYFYGDGHMAANERTPSGHYVDKSGAWVKDEWKKNSTGWWYQYGDGTYAIGWAKVSGKWYYFSRYGYMQIGWRYIDSKWYYMNGSGVMQTGWQKLGRSWYYMNGSGAMQTGWQKLGGKYYYFYGDGHMAANEKTPDGYYVDSSGKLI